MADENPIDDSAGASNDQDLLSQFLLDNTGSGNIEQYPEIDQDNEETLAGLAAKASAAAAGIIDNSNYGNLGISFIEPFGNIEAAFAPATEQVQDPQTMQGVQASLPSAALQNETAENDPGLQGSAPQTLFGLFPQNTNAAAENIPVPDEPVFFVEPPSKRRRLPVIPPPLPEPNPHHPQALLESQPVPINPQYVAPNVPGPVLPDNILPIQHPTIPWLKVPRELTSAGAQAFQAMPEPKHKRGLQQKKLSIEVKYFSNALPYCNLLPLRYSPSAGIDARSVAVPWRIPDTVPCADLLKAVDIMMPHVRNGILDLSSRQSYKITHAIFKNALSDADRKLVTKWCHIPLKGKQAHHQAMDLDMKELQMLYGLTKEAKANITRELRALYRNAYDDRITRVQRFRYHPWTTEEVGKIWNVYSADRTNERMYDTMHAALKRKRNHRSIMRMLEFIVYCEKNPGIANPNMRDAFTIAPIPDAVAPENPMSDGEMRTFLELRSYYGPQDDWIALIYQMNLFAKEFGHRQREVGDAKELYIRHGLDYLSADKWTEAMDKTLHRQVIFHDKNWHQIGENLGRTPHAVMARSNFLRNHPDWDNETGTRKDGSGAGPSNA